MNGRHVCRNEGKVRFDYVLEGNWQGCSEQKFTGEGQEFEVVAVSVATGGDSCVLTGGRVGSSFLYLNARDKFLREMCPPLLKWLSILPAGSVDRGTGVCRAYDSISNEVSFYFHSIYV